MIRIVCALSRVRVGAQIFEVPCCPFVPSGLRHTCARRTSVAARRAVGRAGGLGMRPEHASSAPPGPPGSAGHA